MKLQIFSDCHLNDYLDPKAIWNVVTPDAEIAVIAGDITSNRFSAVTTELASKFKHVVAVLGNHDFYGNLISWKPEVPQNFHLLNPGVVEIDDVVFIGATLWSDFKDLDWFVVNSAKRVEDFTKIDGFSVHQAHDQYRKEKEYLKMMIRKYRGRKVVIVTHFLPTIKLIHEHWRNPSFELLNHYFAADCEDLIYMCDPGTHWVFGHTHNYRDQTIADVRLICNPVGYYACNPAGYKKKSDYQHTILEI